NGVFWRHYVPPNLPAELEASRKERRTMAADFRHPTQECDLVMKGGITSGVVYPPAILKLAQTYRFRAIGGTSAGAIAAAATAAAEFGRESATGGFERFAALSSQLGEEQFLFNLLQPAEATRPLMNSL